MAAAQAALAFASVRRVCSWCGAEFAREQWASDGGWGHGPITTWGICPGCLDQEWSRLPDAVPARAPRGRAGAGERGPRGR